MDLNSLRREPTGNMIRRLGPIELSLWAMVVTGMALRLWLAWQPVTTLVTRYNADDAYYYFTIARNIAQGHGATFDGLAPTNGFHPLYLLLLVPIYWLSPNSLELNVHLSLSVAVLFSVLTALPLYWTLLRLTSPRASLLSVAVWLFGPGAIAIVLEGVESGVYVYFVALTVYLYVLHQTDTTKGFPRWRLFWLGVALGLTILARSDGVLLLAAILVDMVFRRERVRAIALPLASCGLVLLPWLAWNLLTFGSVVQASGAAILYSSAQVPNSVEGMFNSLFVISLSALLLAFPSLVVSLFMGITWIDFRFRRRFAHGLGRQTGARRLFFLFVYVSMLFVFYAWIFKHRQNWYLLPAVFAIALVTGWLFELFTVWLEVRSPLLTANLAGLTIGVVVTTYLLTAWVWESNRMAMHPLQAGGYQIAQWLASETTSGVRIGAWNSGIIGYFSQRSVVNLDGVVNNELLRHVTSRRAQFDLAGEWDYLQAKDVRLVTDYENVLATMLDGKQSDRLKVVHELPGATNQAPIVILEISEDGH